jgi:hypothetical protein
MYTYVVDAEGRAIENPIPNAPCRPGRRKCSRSNHECPRIGANMIKPENNSQKLPNKVLQGLET